MAEPSWLVEHAPHSGHDLDDVVVVGDFVVVGVGVVVDDDLDSGASIAFGVDHIESHFQYFDRYIRSQFVCNL